MPQYSVHSVWWLLEHLFDSNILILWQKASQIILTTTYLNSVQCQLIRFQLLRLQVNIVQLDNNLGFVLLYFCVYGLWSKFDYCFESFVFVV